MNTPAPYPRLIGAPRHPDGRFVDVDDPCGVQTVALPPERPGAAERIGYRLGASGTIHGTMDAAIRHAKNRAAKIAREYAAMESRAAEFTAQTAVDAGLIPPDVARRIARTSLVGHPG